MKPKKFIFNMKVANISRVFPFLVSLIVILLIYIHLQNEDTKNKILILAQVNLLIFSLSVVSFCVAHYFSSIKYSLIVNMYIDPVEKLHVGYINYFSALFANVVPLGPSSDLCRIALLKTNHQIKIGNAVIISILDRCSTILYTTIIGIILLLIQIIILNEFNNFKILIAFWISMILLILFIIFVPNFILFKIYKNIGEKHDVLKRNILSICLNSKVIFLTILHMFFLSLAISLCAQSIIGNIINFNFILLSPLFQIIQSVPIFFGGWGIREGAFLYFIPEVKSILSRNEIFMISILVGFSVLFSTLPSLLFLRKKYRL